MAAVGNYARNEVGESRETAMCWWLVQGRLMVWSRRVRRMVGAPSWRIGGSLVHSLQLTASGGARGLEKHSRSEAGLANVMLSTNTRKQQKPGLSQHCSQGAQWHATYTRCPCFPLDYRGSKRTSERRHHVRPVQKWPPWKRVRNRLGNGETKGLHIRHGHFGQRGDGGQAWQSSTQADDQSRVFGHLVSSTRQSEK